MTKSKYKKGKQICSMADFENSRCKFFKVYFGTWQTKHIGFIVSWQYRLLKTFIDRGWIYEAVRTEDEQQTIPKHP